MFRIPFGEKRNSQLIPSLLELQRKSYDDFIQFDNKEILNQGLEWVFRKTINLRNSKGKFDLTYVSYELTPSNYTPEECKLQGISYSFHLAITCKINIYNKDDNDKDKSSINKKLNVSESFEQKVYCGELPRMSAAGTFIINGIDKTMVTQMHRSPGVFFINDGKKKKNKAYGGYSCKINPTFGSWIEFVVEGKDIMYCKIDKKKKLPVSTFLMCLAKDGIYDLTDNVISPGYEKIDILNIFHRPYKCKILGEKILRKIYYTDYMNHCFNDDVYNIKNEILVKSGGYLENCDEFINDGVECYLSPLDWLPAYGMCTIINPISNEVLVEPAVLIDQNTVRKVFDLLIDSFEIVDFNSYKDYPYIINSIIEDQSMNREDALLMLSKNMKVGKGYSMSSPYQTFLNTFFNNDNYNLMELGRITINERLKIDIPLTTHCLTNGDVIGAIKKLLDVIENQGPVQDIDSLENRRVRTIGENFVNQMILGSRKMMKSVQDKLLMGESLIYRIKEIMSGKLLLYPLKKLLNISSLSQFSEQYNPASFVVHQRRIAFHVVSGDGGGSSKNDRRRIDAARDVHPTYYSKICAIVTPEGQNIGLVNYFALYTKVNRHGLLMAPYYKVSDGKIDRSEIVYLTTAEENKNIIASLETNNLKGDAITIDKEMVVSIKGGEVLMVSKEEVNYVDCSPDQTLSVSAALIPFIECTDGFRAMMGANMQRQAIPVVHKSPPIIGTGIEKLIINETTNVVVKSDFAGIITSVDSNRIIQQSHSGQFRIYELTRFACSNQNTAIGHTPIVKIGDVVEKNQVIADSYCTSDGELSIGNNALVGFIACAPCFEDSIMVSEKFAHMEDKLTSFHIVEFEVSTRDSRLGAELFTRDLPNTAQDRIAHLDEEGIVNVGAYIHGGMILVGKVTPRSSSSALAHQKLLYAIFGEKASEVTDSSFKAPSGIEGVVTNIEILRRFGVEEGESLFSVEYKKIKQMRRLSNDKIATLRSTCVSLIKKMLIGSKLKEKILNFEKGYILESSDLDQIDLDDTIELANNHNDRESIRDIVSQYNSSRKIIEQELQNRESNLKKGFELPVGILKTVKIRVMCERKAQNGDKLAGRYGNKGVISTISKVCDMPYLSDGTPLDVILNSLGVLARMNLGQLWETHAGMACVAIGEKIRQWVIKNNNDFSDVEFCEYIENVSGIKFSTLRSEEQINLIRNLSRGYGLAILPFQCGLKGKIEDYMEMGGLSRDGRQDVYDGKTGDLIGKMCVGYQYILKLCHMARDKIHSRAVGGYSLITQQPLCGKSNSGGQRFGEMEVWALEAYGASFTLQEMLTIKSDSVKGRYGAFEAIVLGENKYNKLDSTATSEILRNKIRCMGMNFDFLYTNRESEELDALIDDNEEGEDNDRSIMEELNRGECEGELSSARTVNNKEDRE